MTSSTMPIVFVWIFAAHQLGAGAIVFCAGGSRDAFASQFKAVFPAGTQWIAAAISIHLLRARTGRAELDAATGVGEGGVVAHVHTRTPRSLAGRQPR